MLNSVTLMGITGPRISKDARTIIVKRAYNEDMLTPLSDSIAVILWSRNQSAPFYRCDDGERIGIKGRLEVQDGQLVVIAEQVYAI